MIYTRVFTGCASRSPEASQTQLRRVKAICDLARLASGIIDFIVAISVFNLLLYREIKNNQDQIDMQRDLDALMDWDLHGA